MTFRIAFVIAAIGGFLSLSYEILWYRVASFKTEGYAGTFGVLLAIFLFGVAVGSRRAERLCESGAPVGDRRQLGRIAGLIALASVSAWLVIPALAWTSRFFALPIALGTVGIAAALFGTLLPLVSHYAVAPDGRSGLRTSQIYGANIVGSASGSLATGFVFLDLWPATTVTLILALVGLALAALVALVAAPTRAVAGRWVGGVGLAAIAVVTLNPILHDRMYERLLFGKRFDGTQRFIDQVETRSGVVSVTADKRVFGGGAYDGAISTSLTDDVNAIYRAYALAALRPAPKRVLMIGLSTGAWAEVVANLPGVESLDVIEINPGYLQVIARYPEVAPILSNPHVAVHIDDGRRWLLRHPDAKFDVVLMNTTWHWREHATNLLSQEFMELVRSHLAPDGLFYFNTTFSPDVQRTAAATYANVLRVFNFIAASDGPLVFDDERWASVLRTATLEGKPVLDLSTPGGRAAYERLTRDARDPNSLTTIALENRAHLLQRIGAEGIVVTDDNMASEWHPARAP